VVVYFRGDFTFEFIQIHVNRKRMFNFIIFFCFCFKHSTKFGKVFIQNFLRLCLYQDSIHAYTMQLCFVVCEKRSTLCLINMCSQMQYFVTEHNVRYLLNCKLMLNTHQTWPQTVFTHFHRVQFLKPFSTCPHKILWLTTKTSLIFSLL
jgi:hypothetical protein